MKIDTFVPTEPRTPALGPATSVEVLDGSGDQEIMINTIGDTVVDIVKKLDSEGLLNKCLIRVTEVEIIGRG